MSDDDVRGGYPTGGHHPERNGRTPEHWENSALPTDLGAVQADDALLDSLGGPRPVDHGSDAQLAQVLVAWRREVDSEPVEQLVDVDTALAMVARARRPVSRRSPMLVPFAAAAAALVIAFSGVSLGARAAEPGDRLWSVTNVLYPEHARSVEAAFEVRKQLQQARNALQEGRTDKANAELQKADQELPVVDHDDGRAELEADRNELKQELARRSGPDSPAPASSPAAPPPAAADTATSTKPSPTTTATTPAPTPEPPAADSPAPQPPPPSPQPGSDPGTGDAGASGPAPLSDPTPLVAAPPAPAAPPQ